MTKVDCEDCYEKFTSKKLYINHVKTKSCSKTKVKNRQRTGQVHQEAATQAAKRVRLEGVLHSVTNIWIFKYIRIFSATNICSYHIRILFLIRIYSDIRSYCFFQYKYIRIFVRIKISHSSHYASKTNLTASSDSGEKASDSKCDKVQ